MPVSLSQILRNTARIEIPIGDDTLTIDYYPGKLTEDIYLKFVILQKVTNPEEALTSFREFNAILVELIKSWDLYADDEQSTLQPIDEEHMSQIPIELRMQIILSIMENIRPE